MAYAEPAEGLELGSQALDELPPGTTLLHGQYKITSFLNNGGFGITYLAKDSLDRDVVIKECFADAFCRRTNTIVSARSRAHQGEMKSIIRHFIQEARSLSKLQHPNIVGVHQVFEDNDTAYMAIDYVDGMDLLEIIENPEAHLTPPQIVAITRKLLSAVGYIHDHGLLHRDISPDNILLNREGEPILIDFGAAREDAVEGGRKHSALRVVKDGYSPQEFYIAGSAQGPWSDLYALAASLYHAIRGEAPVNGQARLAAIAEQQTDPYVPLAGLIPGYPRGFLEAIDKAMNTRPANRLQSAADWLAMIDTSAATVAPRRVTVTAPQPAIAAAAPKGGKGKLLGGLALALLVAGGVGYGLTAGKAPDAPVVSAPAAKPAVEAVAKVPEAPVPAKPEPAAPAKAEAKPEVVKPVVAAAAEPEAPKPAVTAESAPAVPVAATPAPVEAVAEPVMPPKPVLGRLVEQQIGFTLWDVAIPFDYVETKAGDSGVALVSGVTSNIDNRLVGEWLTEGTEIYAVNDQPLSEDQRLSSLILNAMKVDPDGYTRVSVRYKTAGMNSFDHGLLAVPAVRRIGLVDGTMLEAGMEDGAWQIAVVSVGTKIERGLEPGDVLLREAVSGVEIKGVDELETALNDLVSKSIGTAQFEILRDGAPLVAEMRLARQS